MLRVNSSIKSRLPMLLAFLALLFQPGLFHCSALAIDKDNENAITIADYAHRAIEPKSKSGTALSYHDIEIDSSDQRSSEALLRLSAYGVSGEAFYARKDGLNAPYHRCVCAEDAVLKSRKSVAEKLKHINQKLDPLGLELYVFDAYRPLSCQRELWSYFLEEAKRILVSATQEEVIEYAGKFCSNPTAYDAANYKTWPTHLTGGAVDLTIRRKADGQLLYMGGVFDDASDISFTRHFEKPEMTSASEAEAQKNRRLLYWLMREEGFANYPNEWWHFDYGNQMWVQNRDLGQTGAAFFGKI